MTLTRESAEILPMTSKIYLYCSHRLFPELLGFFFPWTSRNLFSSSSRHFCESFLPKPTRNYCFSKTAKLSTNKGPKKKSRFSSEFHRSAQKCHEVEFFLLVFFPSHLDDDSSNSIIWFIVSKSDFRSFAANNRRLLSGEFYSLFLARTQNPKLCFVDFRWKKVKHNATLKIIFSTSTSELDDEVGMRCGEFSAERV